MKNGGAPGRSDFAGGLGEVEAKQDRSERVCPEEPHLTPWYCEQYLELGRLVQER